MNLRHVANTREVSEFRSRTSLEPPTFATGPFLGNIGGPVHTFLDELDEELEINVTADGIRGVSSVQRGYSGVGYIDDTVVRGDEGGVTERSSV